MNAPSPSLTVALTGASGTIGSATLLALHQAGHRVVCITREDLQTAHSNTSANTSALAERLRREGVQAVVSCMASRTGTREDAWRVDHDAQRVLLQSAVQARVQHFVLLSAICVQRPKLVFQEAKLAFEASLRAAPLQWTIVRPTAFFKSLSGQIKRVAAGKPFLVFGSGTLTACKPISDRDLASFLVNSLTNPSARCAVLPIGGPGPALTPMDQAAILERVLGRPVRVKRVPPGLLRLVARGLDVLSLVLPRLAEKAEYARIGHYYATESMLVWNEETQRYDADGTPNWGQDRLEEHYRNLLLSVGSKSS